MKNEENYIFLQKHDPLSIFLILLYFWTKILRDIFHFVLLSPYCVSKVLSNLIDYSNLNNKNHLLNMSLILHFNSCLVPTLGSELSPELYCFQYFPSISFHLANFHLVWLLSSTGHNCQHFCLKVTFQLFPKKDYFDISHTLVVSESRSLILDNFKC